MSRTLSTERQARPKPSGGVLALLPARATSSVCLDPALAKAQFDIHPMTEPAIQQTKDLPDAEREGGKKVSPVLRDMPFKPTPPSTTENIPFGRTKSELTVILSRDKARS